MFEKIQVAHAGLIPIKLAFCTTPGPEPFPLRQACNVPYYLDALDAHVGSISVTSAQADHQDSIHKFKVVTTVFSEMKPSDLKEP